MERDFLGIDDQKSAAAVKKSTGGRLETASSADSNVQRPLAKNLSASSADSNVQRPLANNASAIQKLISFETVQNNKHKGVSFNPQFTQKFFSPQAFQRYLGHGVIRNNRLAFEEPFRSVITNKTSMVNLTPRANEHQLTIFYAGSVNVYDNITFDTARRIMLMASKGSNTAVRAVNPKSGASSVPPLFKGLVFNGQNLTQTLNNTNHVACSCSGHSKTVSGDANSIRAMILPSHSEPPKLLNASMGPVAAETTMPKAVPQARKASLVRFLEKRKERLGNMIPYSREKKPSKNSIPLNGASPSSKCASADLSIASNLNQSWLLSQTKSCNESDDSPSTKLEMVDSRWGHQRHVPLLIGV